MGASLRICGSIIRGKCVQYENVLDGCSSTEQEEEEEAKDASLKG